MIIEVLQRVSLELSKVQNERKRKKMLIDLLWSINHIISDGATFIEDIMNLDLKEIFEEAFESERYDLMIPAVKIIG